MKNFYHRGITLLEVIIVIAILGILAAIIIPQFSRIKELQALKNAGEDIISNFNQAKSETLASLNSSEYGVHFESDRIIIFKGEVFVAGDSNNVTTNIIPPAVISNIALTGGAVDFYFERLTGAPSKTGTITIALSADASVNKVLTISATGSISMN
jgi:prepilin-type N-terminal cleavage/methylation domain-containing protein